MANEKIHTYLFERNAGTLLGTEFFDLDATNDLGVSYVSNKLTLDNLVTYISANALNIYNANGILQSERRIISPNLGITLDAGDFTIEMNDEVNDHAFILLDSAAAERGRYGFDQVSGSGILELSNISGTWFNANDEVLAVNDNVLYVTDKVQLGLEDTAPTRADMGSTAVVVKGSSNNGLTITNATLDGVTPNTTAENVNLFFQTRDSLGDVATTSQIFIKNRNVTAGSVYGMMIINKAVHTQNANSNNEGRTLIANQDRNSSGTPPAILNVLNADVSSTTAVLVVDSFRQDDLSTSIIVRSSSNGTTANTFNWRLKNNHEFTHNDAQLDTGDFIMKGDTDASAFVMDASSDNCGFGVAVPLEKVHSLEKVRADDAFNLNGNDGISETLNFGGGGSGDILTITVEGGIITARTLVP